LNSMRRQIAGGRTPTSRRCGNVARLKGMKLRSRRANESLRAAGPLVKKHVTARKGLRVLGILRTNRSLQDDYAEWLAAQMLSLTLCSNPIQKGYDAVDSGHHRYQVKSRIVRSLQSTTSFDFNRSGSSFDYFVAVFFSEALDVLGVALAPRSVVQDYCTETKSTVRFRWNSRTANDLRIRRLYWMGRKTEAPRRSQRAGT
jgi:hypothetical protein